jgi:hypothetical protein
MNHCEPHSPNLGSSLNLVFDFTSQASSPDEAGYRFLRLRGLCCLALTLGLRLERLLKVLGIDTCLGTLRPSHRWSLRPVHLDELGLRQASGEGELRLLLVSVFCSNCSARLSRGGCNTTVYRALWE